MCSTGVSVWFACKLCKSFFLNADDFAYHKRKSHVQEFQNTKFIVFEEQTTPPASPPENWVSFLAPKEETRIHKIISSPLPSASNTTNVDGNRLNENIQSNPNKKSIEIDPEITNAGKEPNNCVELSFNFSLNDDALIDVNDQANYKKQSNVVSTSTESASKDENGDKLRSSRINVTIKRKTSSLRRSTRKIQNLSANKVLLQSVIQSQNNPYVYLERLNLITIQNAPSPSPSNSTTPILSQVNDQSDTNHNNSDASSAKEPKVKCENPGNIIQRSSTFTSPPIAAANNCKCCYDHFNSTPELDAQEDICPSQRQFENVNCVPPLLTFCSSDELNAHNQVVHSTSISTLLPETTNGHQPQLADGFEVQVASRNEIQSDFLPAHCNKKSSMNELSQSSNLGDHAYNTNFNRDFELGAVSNDDNNDTLVPDPTTQVVDLNFGSAFELVKTEYVTQGIDDREFPDEDRDPFESVSQMESPAKLSFDLAASSSSYSELIQTDTSRYCISCQKNFISVGELRAHNRSFHGTQYSTRKFKCPHPNCRTSAKTQNLLKMHLMQVHSNARPYNCLHHNCTLSFKTTFNRNIHFKRAHRKLFSSSCQLSTRFERTNEGVKLFNHSATELVPQADFGRYCILCKKSFTSTREIGNHNKTYHTTQEGRLRFSCPYSNCEVKARDQCNLKTHLMQVHSNLRPFKCLHSNCKMYFKTTNARNQHFKRHTSNTSAYLN